MKVYLVNLIESERGWGSKIDEQYIFPTEELAIECAKLYNEKYNTGTTTPDWYMMMEYEGAVKVSKDQFNKFKYKGDLVSIPNDWVYTG